MEAGLEESESERLRIELPKEALELEVGVVRLRTGSRELLTDTLGNQCEISSGYGHPFCGGSKASRGFGPIIPLGLLVGSLGKLQMEIIGFIRENTGVHHGTVSFRVALG
jgi:hypothetical protein